MSRILTRFPAAGLGLAGAVLALGLVGCGGSNPAGPGPIPSPSPTPPLAARSMIVVGAQNNTFTVSSRQQVLGLTLICGNAHVEWVFAEQAGLGATLNQADVWLLSNDGNISGRRVTPASDRLEAHSSITFQSDRIECGYVGRDYPFSFHSEWAFTDDHGNHITVTDAVGLVEQ